MPQQQLEATVVARLLLTGAACQAPAVGGSLLAALLPTALVVEHPSPARLARAQGQLAGAVQAACPGAVVAALLSVVAAAASAPDGDEPPPHGAVAPRGCAVHREAVLRAACAASPELARWHRVAASARFHGAPLLLALAEPELAWETPFAGCALSPADAVSPLLASLVCGDCAYAGFVSGEGCAPPAAASDAQPAPPAQLPVELRTGRGAPVVVVAFVAQPSLLPHALLRAVRGLRPVSLPAAHPSPLPPLAPGAPAAERALALMPHALVPTTSSAASGAPTHARRTDGAYSLRVDLWVRLHAAGEGGEDEVAPARAGAARKGAAPGASGGCELQTPPAAPPSPWHGMAGFPALVAELTDHVVAPVAAARAAASAAAGAAADGAAAGCVSPALALARAMRTLRVGPPRGLLLHGPTGCGKTAWARALARAAGLRLLHVACPRLPSRYVGDSEAAVRAAFRAARAAAPCLLLLDDLHVIAAARTMAAAVAPAGAATPAARRKLPRPTTVSEAAGMAGPSAEEDVTSDDEEGVSSCGSISESDGVEAFSSHLPDGLPPPPAGGGGGGGVLDRMLATLLNELDGVGLRSSEGGMRSGGRRRPESSDDARRHGAGDGDGDGEDGLVGYVLVVATTDTPRRLDPAVTRPGRLELHVAVPPVTSDGDALALLRHATRGMALGGDVQLPALAAQLLLASSSRPRARLTPADVAHGVATAALAALQEATSSAVDELHGDEGGPCDGSGGGAGAGRKLPPRRPAAVGLRHLQAAFGLARN